MLSNFNTYNVLHKILAPSTRCLYENNNTLFDKIIQMLGVEVHSGSLNIDLSYDVYISTNYLNHSMHRQNAIADYHVCDAVILSELVASNLKKEDKLLLRNSLKDTHKIITHSSLQEHWSFLETKLHYIPYGIPILDDSVLTKNKSVIIINLKNNLYLDNIYNYIKQFLPDCGIIKNIVDMDLYQIQKILSEYKVCILDSSIIDTIISSYCGCFIITNGYKFDENIRGIFNCNSPNEIISHINPSLSSYDLNQQIELSKYLASSYKWDSFFEHMNELLIQTKSEIFKI